MLTGPTARYPSQFRRLLRTDLGKCNTPNALALPARDSAEWVNVMFYIAMLEKKIATADLGRHEKAELNNEITRLRQWHGMRAGVSPLAKVCLR